jgi:regulator of protease activity HflC (stomatin/prohibitin superfamily)
MGPLSKPLISFLANSNSCRFYNSFVRRRMPLPSNTIVKFVPQQEAWVVERFGKFNRVLDPGLAFLVPVIDKIKYVKTLKEVAVEIPSQSAITQDNVTISLDGVLYYRITDPYKASYGVEDADFSVAQLAQTTMRSEIGQLTLDRTLAERSQLNVNIVRAINEAATAWGILCMRYEIRDIQPPEQVVKAMHSQVSAERQKRAQILDSEGSRQAAINVAEGEKQSKILSSEGFCQEQINRATGEYEAVLLRAKASAETIRIIGEAIGSGTGAQAVSMIVAEKYLEAFSKLAKESTTLMLPAGVAEPSAMVAQAMKIYTSINKE